MCVNFVFAVGDTYAQHEDWKEYAYIIILYFANCFFQLYEIYFVVRNYEIIWSGQLINILKHTTDGKKKRVSSRCFFFFSVKKGKFSYISHVVFHMSIRIFSCVFFPFLKSWFKEVRNINQIFSPKDHYKLHGQAPLVHSPCYSNSLVCLEQLAVPSSPLHLSRLARVVRTRTALLMAYHRAAPKTSSEHHRPVWFVWDRKYRKL